MKRIKLDKADLLEFLKKLAEGDTSVLEQLASQEEDEPCNNPLCPSCMWRHGDDPETLGMRVKDTFALLTPEELLEGITILFGAAARCYNELPPSAECHELGVGIAAAIKYLRKKNEKFAFATNANHVGEGKAKH